MRTLKIIHFNDVYHVEPLKKEPVGGAARFISAINGYSQKQQSLDNGNKPLVLFSGDAFNPSLESSVTKGEHMVPILNATQADVAVYGNHDFDFGVSVLAKLAAKCSFPWLLSNVFDSGTGKPLADGHEYLVIHRYGLKIGVIGIVEQEWLETIPSLPPTVEYRDFVKTAKTLAQTLKNDHDCTFIIALTHMRIPNDEILSKECPEVDLILGGHDHFFRVIGAQSENENEWRGKDIRVIKSGADFREVSFISIDLDDTSKIQDVLVKRLPITSAICPSLEIETLIKETTSIITSKLGVPVAISLSGLEARSTHVRTQESNLGSFSADLLRLTYGCDITLLCGGAFRGDEVYGPGVVTIRDVMDVFPFEDACVVIKIKGKHIFEALENGVSAVPEKTEGRFPQISGIRFEYDTRRPVSQRVVSCTLTSKSRNEPLDPEREYTVATREYLAQGNDGFKSLLMHSGFVVDAENGLLLSCIIRRVFLGAKYVNIMKSRLGFNGSNFGKGDDSPGTSTTPTGERSPTILPPAVAKAIQKFRERSPTRIAALAAVAAAAATATNQVPGVASPVVVACAKGMVQSVCNGLSQYPSSIPALAVSASPRAINDGASFWGAEEWRVLPVIQPLTDGRVKDLNPLFVALI